MHFTFFLLILSLVYVSSSKLHFNPGRCAKDNHGKSKLIQGRELKERFLICMINRKGLYAWKAIDGSKTTGEYFDPAYDCSDILNKDADAKDGFYWINFGKSRPKKVWCDLTTDGGGYMLIGRKRSASTWSVPSNNKTVKPFGFPHWTSDFGDAPILDFRVQMATKEDFAYTRAHWSYRLQAKRPLKNLLLTNQGGCDRHSAGIGNIAYVKDLQTEKLVSTNFRCSKFGVGHHPSIPIGWTMMNSCLRKPCHRGFAFHDKFPNQTDYSGAFSYSATGSVSGIDHISTAFIGCDNGYCCACFGPVGGTKNYCSHECNTLNKGSVTKNVFTWFWMRSTLPKRIWKKCMDYKVTNSVGKIIWYKILGESAVPVEGRCSENTALLYNGIVVVPNASAAKKIPPASGLLAYRKDNKELYLRANQTWNVIAQEKKVNMKLDKLEKLYEKLNKSVMPLSDCPAYGWLTDANRNEKDTSDTVLCDNGISSGWYKFGGAAGTQMPTSCVSENGCGTHAPGWLNGAHPTVLEGKVTRKVCYSYSGNCCSWSNNIEVLNCGYFYIYKLSTPPTCSLRYCGSDV